MALALGGPLRGPGVAHYLVFYSLAFILYLAALALLFRWRPSLSMIWLAAVVFRLALFLSPPTLSDDVYRYIWDGHLAANGVNPYALAVNSPDLDRLATAQRELVNNNWMASPYLPAAQLVFAGVASLAPGSTAAFQVLMAGFDLLAGALLMGILRRLGQPPELAMAYLLNPFTVVEFAHSGHLDALMIALTLGSLLALLEGRRGLSAFLLALATLTKGVPALLLFAIWPRWRARDWLIYAGTILGLSLPYVVGAGLGLAGPRNGVGLLGAIRLYSYQWNFNGGVYHWLEGWTTGIQSPGGLSPETPGVLAAKLIAAGLLGVALLWIAWRARQTKDNPSLLRLSLAPFAAYLLLTTTVHPWYVTLLVPFVAFELAWRNGPAHPGLAYGAGVAVVYWSWSVGLSYLTYLDPANLRETDLVRQWEYFPVYLLLLLALGLRMYERHRASSETAGVWKELPTLDQKSGADEV